MVFVEIYKKSGTHLILNKQHIVIDPLSHTDSDIVLISHAHADHCSLPAFKKFSQPIYLSQPTLDIINMRTKQTTEKENIQIVKSGEEFNLDGIKIQVFEAGHCIGSLQFKLSYRQKTIIYTGDFCVEPRMGMYKGTILTGRNSTLITDSTYSNEKYIFPARNDVYREIYEWLQSVFRTHNIAILFARPLGTAQELTELINMSTLNCDIFVHPSIYYHNLIHNNYYPLGNFQYRKNLFDSSLDKFLFPKTPKKKRKKVFLLPLFLYNKEQLPKLREIYGKSMAICTGWALTQRFAIKSFALTSHSGHNAIQQYLVESGAKDIMYF